MFTRSKVWGTRLALLLATCFGVFVLPFLLPAPYLKGVSASNLAGFNNRVAALAAAGFGTLLFLLALKWPQLMGAPDDRLEDGKNFSRDEYERLPWLLVIIVALLWAVATLLFGLQIIRMGFGYTNDWGYFINQISMYTDYGRSLYTQIEFSYGPLLFYGPVALRWILSPFHASAAGAFLATLVLEITIGLFLMAYLINYLPMSKRWKEVMFTLFAVGMFVGNMALNHTFLRFASPMALLMMTSQRKKPWSAALWILAGEAICLGLSPDMGFAFLAGSLGLAVYRCFTLGKSWLLAVVAPVVSAMLFLWIVGPSYLQLLGMISHGVYNFPVEPLPYVALFLFALVWLVPVSLATFFLQHRPEAPILGTLYLVSLALLPAAFGRADPGHLFWNGLSLYLLAAVAISSRRRWQQIAWGSCVALMILWMCNINRHVNWFEIKPVLVAEAKSCCGIEKLGQSVTTPQDDGGFDLKSLQEIVGHDPVATPAALPQQVIECLRESKQYTPAFFDFSMSLLDANAEDRQIREFNQSKWALLPPERNYGYAERPEDLNLVLGFAYPYRTRRPVYPLGLRFAQNLAENWRVRGKVGRFLVYQHV